ncbi:hypothetical protein KC349_g155 [Hortaea werneckii]|nr:hypothetical protein KC349_g155 [Hortaea werneckii]
MAPVPTRGRIQPVIPLPLEKKKAKSETSRSSENGGYVRPSATSGLPPLPEKKDSNNVTENSRSRSSVPTVFPTQSQQLTQGVVNGTRHASIAAGATFPELHDSSYVGYIIDKTSTANNGKASLEQEKQHFLANNSGQHIKKEPHSDPLFPPSRANPLSPSSTGNQIHPPSTLSHPSPLPTTPTPHPPTPPTCGTQTPPPPKPSSTSSPQPTVAGPPSPISTRKSPRLF